MPFHPAHEMHGAGIVDRRQCLTAVLLVLAAHGLLLTLLLLGLAYHVVKAPVLPKMVMASLPRTYIPAPPVAPPALHQLFVAPVTAVAPDIVIESRTPAPAAPVPVIATVPASAMTMSSSGGTAGKGAKAGASGAGAAGRASSGGDSYDLSPYLALVARHIQRHLIPPASMLWRNSTGGTVLLHLIFRPDGSVQLAEIARSSGVKLFDEAALAAVRRSDPLPPFPPEVRLDHINGVIPVTFTITSFMGK